MANNSWDFIKGYYVINYYKISANSFKLAIAFKDKHH